MPAVYSRPVVPRYPQAPWPPLPEPERKRRMNALARADPAYRADHLLDCNLYIERDGWIYALAQWVYDWGMRVWYVGIKYGLTSDLARRMSEYDDCPPTNWLFAWPTKCVKLTEAVIHARLRSRGIAVGLFPCPCGHSHREFFWGWGIGDVCREVEEVLFDTAQPIHRYYL
ncbi:hypothetical protein R3P38DRAFT_3181917 [Favolaschia claudopus]|uniref:Bacteriophage T5 Orf172 DNA-binding domain-containing protein n=1 Tax=Favolaschia claudopus TaxID=2862362 RepID=A0AAW0CFB3_9AGAR